MAYSRQWSDICDHIRADLSRGSDAATDPIDLLSHAMMAQNERFASNKMFFDVHRALGMRVIPNQTPDQVLSVQDGAYVLRPVREASHAPFYAAIASQINEGADPPTDAVVELGAGTGINLFKIARLLGPEQRERTAFYSCELTAAGREVCELIASSHREYNIRALAFDYYKPDFSFLEGKQRVVFITAHSLEQIPVVNRSLFEAMLTAAPACTCFHAEPVGWQATAYLREMRRARNSQVLGQLTAKAKELFFKADSYCYLKLGTNMLNATRRFDLDISISDIGLSEKVSSNAARYSAVLNYNTNLLPVVDALEDAGAVSVHQRNVNAYGVNPFNPTTLINWSKT